MKQLKHIKAPVGILDNYNRGKIVHIDFTYCDYIIVWVEYNKLCRAYLSFS